jgi:hypothetical protein
MQSIGEAISAGNEYQRRREEWIDKLRLRRRDRNSAYIEHKKHYNSLKTRLMDTGLTGVRAAAQADKDPEVLKLEATLLDAEVQLEEAKQMIGWCKDGADLTRSEISGIKEEMGMV